MTGIPGDLPEFASDPCIEKRMSLADVDSVLKCISDTSAVRHINKCGIRVVTSNPLAISIPPDTSLLLILDIDETLVDARSTPPMVHVRPGVVELFARLNVLRQAGVQVWLWTAAIGAHAARCVGVLHHTFGAELPVDTVVVRGPEWMSKHRCCKDTTSLCLAAADRVLLVDNTPTMVIARPESALVVPSYTHYGRHVIESTDSRPTLVRIADIVEGLAAAPTVRVADHLAHNTSELGVRPWTASGHLMQLLYDISTAPALVDTPTPTPTPTLTPTPTPVLADVPTPVLGDVLEDVPMDVL